MFDIDIKGIKLAAKEIDQRASLVLTCDQSYCMCCSQKERSWHRLHKSIPGGICLTCEHFNENERAYLKEKAIKHYIEPWKENQKERGRINIRLKGGGEGGKITSAWSEGVHLQITGADIRRLRSETCLQFPLCDIFCQLGS